MCLQSIYKNLSNNFKIFVVDNNSEKSNNDLIKSYCKKKSIYFINSETNGGFAYGINLALRKINHNNDEYIWVLNNDAIVVNNTLDELIKYYESDNFGLIGSKVMDYTNPNLVQSNHGYIIPLLGLVRMSRSEKICFENFYPIGASLFTSTSVLKKVGLFDESFFLYYEELDYATRVEKFNFKVGVCNKSKVFHKQGSSTNSKTRGDFNFQMELIKEQSFFNYYSKYYSNYFISAYFGIFLKLFKNIYRLNFKVSKFYYSLLKSKLNGR